MTKQEQEKISKGMIVNHYMIFWRLFGKYTLAWFPNTKLYFRPWKCQHARYYVWHFLKFNMVVHHVFIKGIRED